MTPHLYKKHELLVSLLTQARLAIIFFSRFVDLKKRAWKFVQFSAFVTRKFKVFGGSTVERSKICLLIYFPKRKSFHLLMNEDDLVAKV